MRLIDADKFKDEMQYVCDAGGWLEPVTKAVTEYVKKQIDAQPTVDAQPVRHGKFIGTGYDGYADGCPVYYEWKCSECGCIFEGDEPTYNYCPNCGADMRGEKE